MTSLVIDTSALVAVLLGEPGSEELLDHMGAAEELAMAAPTSVELGIVMEAKKGPAVTTLVDQLVREARIELVPFDQALARRALEGWRRYGKGRHRAGLNLGDCFSYALALERQVPILCVGNDFALTDVEVAST